MTTYRITLTNGAATRYFDGLGGFRFSPDGSAAYGQKAKARKVATGLKKRNQFGGSIQVIAQVR